MAEQHPGYHDALFFRVPTQGPWVQFKKPLLKLIPVLDTTKLSGRQAHVLTSVYDKVSSEPLLPLPEMASDPNRIALDDAIAKAFRVPDLSALREMLAKEPIISGKPLY